MLVELYIYLHATGTKTEHRMRRWFQVVAHMQHIGLHDGSCMYKETNSDLHNTSKQKTNTKNTQCSGSMSLDGAPVPYMMLVSMLLVHLAAACESALCARFPLLFVTTSTSTTGHTPSVVTRSVCAPRRCALTAETARQDHTCQRAQLYWPCTCAAGRVATWSGSQGASASGRQARCRQT